MRSCCRPETQEAPQLRSSAAASPALMFSSAGVVIGVRVVAIAASRNWSRNAFTVLDPRLRERAVVAAVVAHSRTLRGHVQPARAIECPAGRHDLAATVATSCRHSQADRSQSNADGYHPATSCAWQPKEFRRQIWVYAMALQHRSPAASSRQGVADACPMNQPLCGTKNSRSRASLGLSRTCSVPRKKIPRG